jgi:hypothetical protein
LIKIEVKFHKLRGTIAGTIAEVEQDVEAAQRFE